MERIEVREVRRVIHACDECGTTVHVQHCWACGADLCEKCQPALEAPCRKCPPDVRDAFIAWRDSMRRHDAEDEELKSRHDREETELRERFDAARKRAADRSSAPGEPHA